GADVDLGAWWSAFDDGIVNLDPSELGGGQAPELLEVDCESCGQERASKLPAYVALAAEDMPNPWVLPQPEDPPCPMCGIQDDDAYLTLDTAYNGMALRNVVVTLFDAVGNREQLYYGALPLNSGSVYVLTDTELQLLDRSSTVPVAAWIDMVFLDAAGGVITAGNQVPVL
ncbi:MAG: hypothetical protein KC431_04905, partial [Myxococcales bacterium]|nr:hypothetical protein [Myxococcales bacterium]